MATLTTTPTVALVGNPNTGKTTLFNALAGMRQRTGNYPGVTVETKKGRMRHGGQPIDLIDLPGTYSLAPRSPDEMVAVDLVLGHLPDEPRPDVVVAIVDASNLDRNLYLVTQVLELGVPVVVALNMVDVAEGQGLRVDAERLEHQLGVAIVAIQANKGKNLDRLRQAVLGAIGGPAPQKLPTFPAAFEREVAFLGESLGSAVEPFLIRRLLLDVGGHLERKLGQAERVREARARLDAAGCKVPAVEARVRYGWIREATSGVVERPAVRPVSWTDRLDRVLTHRVWGTLIFMALMFVVFQSIFTWAKPLMDLIGGGMGALGELVGGALDRGPLRSLLVDGVIKGVGGVVVFIPQIAILFGFIAVLEDCGYMARAAFLMDRLMARCGLNGKSFIPLLSSVACAVPGIMAARVIESRRDRLATILVAPLMSCSARLPVYILLIAAFFTKGYAWWVPGMVMFSMYAIGLIVAPLVALLLKRTLLRGETPPFVMEMPLYKRPSLTAVVQRMLGATWMFIRRAGTIILACMIVVWALLYFPHTDAGGVSYDNRLADMAAPIQADKERLEELEKPVKEEKEELEDLQAKKADGEESAEDKARREELEAKLAPVLEAMKPLQEKIEPVEKAMNELRQKWAGESYLGRVGKWIEPAVEPLGWDWRIGVAAVASFPAREVMVGTLGLVFSQGKGEAGDAAFRRTLGETLRAEERDGAAGERLFNPAVALSVMVFFALCCQCASTLAVIKRETNSWAWPVFTFVYMTALAYIGALATYQIGRLFL